MAILKRDFSRVSIAECDETDFCVVARDVQALPAKFDN